MRIYRATICIVSDDELDDVEQLKVDLEDHCGLRHQVRVADIQSAEIDDEDYDVHPLNHMDDEVFRSALDEMFPQPRTNSGFRPRETRLYDGIEAGDAD